MRIEINGNGGVVASYQNKLDTLYDRINDTIEALQKVNRDISDVNGVKNGNLQLAQSSIDSRIRIEENKRDKVFRLQQQSNTFFDHAVEVDKRVAATIEQNEKQFYEKHPHRPIAATLPCSLATSSIGYDLRISYSYLI